MTKPGTGHNEDGESETTTISLQVTEQQLEEIDATWKEEGHTSRNEFLRHAIRDATEYPGASRSILASIAAEEYAMRRGEGEAISREEIVARMDDDE